MRVIKRTASDRLAEMAGDRIWPLVNRYGTHSEPVKRALRAWGAIWEGIHEGESVSNSEALAGVLPNMGEPTGGGSEMGDSPDKFPERSAAAGSEVAGGSDE